MSPSPATTPSKVNNQTVDVKKNQAAPDAQNDAPSGRDGSVRLRGILRLR